MQTEAEIKIKTTDHGSIPVLKGWARVWSAIDEYTYDGAEDSKSRMGWGSTEAEAIADLKEQMGA